MRHSFITFMFASFAAFFAYCHITIHITAANDVKTDRNASSVNHMFMSLTQLGFDGSAL